jgi:hypothetical protein
MHLFSVLRSGWNPLKARSDSVAFAVTSMTMMMFSVDHSAAA